MVGAFTAISRCKLNNDFTLAFYGAVYGIQRTNRKGFNINAELGYGYYRGDGVANSHGPLLNLNFGWVATKKKKRDKERIDLDKAFQ